MVFLDNCIDIVKHHHNHLMLSHQQAAVVSTTQPTTNEYHQAMTVSFKLFDLLQTIGKNI
jgi:hypothetical protein